MRMLAMFPGQGSQRSGMATELLYNYSDVAGAVFAEANEVLGFPCNSVCSTSSAEELVRTEVAQPCIVATSLAIYAVLREGGVSPTVVAGHSLGEFSALAAAGVITNRDALLLVRKRGELMAKVATSVGGGMTAIFGLDTKAIERICGWISQEVGLVSVANYNAPTQVVVSGLQEAVDAVSVQAIAAGAERVVPLRVGAPFHCALIQEIEDEFEETLRSMSFSNPQIPVISSVTGRVISNGEEARKLLRLQLTKPVHWVDVLHRARGLGITRYVEVGPGRVLSGLANLVLGDGHTTHSTHDSRRIASLLRCVESEFMRANLAVA